MNHSPEPWIVKAHRTGDSFEGIMKTPFSIPQKPVIVCDREEGYFDIANTLNRACPISLSGHASNAVVLPAMENAERIAACVNYCKELTNEELTESCWKRTASPQITQLNTQDLKVPCTWKN